MIISRFACRFGPVLTSIESRSFGGGRLRRLVGRHRLTEEERVNLRDYYRHNRVPTAAIITASLGGHR